MSYETYKVLHLFSLFFFLATSVALLLQPQAKIYKMISGIAFLGAFTGGMGLMARLGGGMQPWIMLKLILLLALTAFVHVVAKRFPALATRALWVLIACFCLGATLAIYKPML